MSDLLKLISLVALPVLIPILVVVALMGSGSSIKERFVSALTLNSDRGLSSQGLLWLSIFTPILYFLALGFISWQGYKISITSDGLDTFFRISKLPLTILALSISLPVLVSRLHATKQTADQIQLTRLKNNLDLFHSHRNDLFNYFSQIGEIKYLDCLDVKYRVHPRIHKNFFKGDPQNGVPQNNVDAFKDIESELDLAKLMLDSVINDKQPQLTFSYYIANLCSAIYRLSMKLGLPEIFVTIREKSVLVPITINNEKKELLTVGTTTDEVVAAYRYAKNYFQNLCDFARYKCRENMVTQDLEYIDSGDQFQKIREDKVIERLHRNEISKILKGGPPPSFAVGLGNSQKII